MKLIFEDIDHITADKIFDILKPFSTYYSLYPLANGVGFLCNLELTIHERNVKGALIALLDDPDTKNSRGDLINQILEADEEKLALLKLFLVGS